MVIEIRYVSRGRRATSMSAPSERCIQWLKCVEKAAAFDGDVNSGEENTDPEVMLAARFIRVRRSHQGHLTGRPGSG